MSLSLLVDTGGEGEGEEGNRGQGQDRAEDKLLRRKERKERNTGGQTEGYIEQNNVTQMTNQYNIKEPKRN